MKKLLITAFLSLILVSCGTAYNTQLKQVQLGMTDSEIVSLMGDKYTVIEQSGGGNSTLMYSDRYKNDWYFVFVDGKLNKWYKEIRE